MGCGLSNGLKEFKIMTVKVGFCDFWQGVKKEEFILVKALREFCDVEIMDNPVEADYVFFSIFGDDHWFLPDKSIKIFYTGENVCPDFNACDYAVGFERMSYGDRYMRLPNYLATPFFKQPTLLMEEKHLSEIPEKTAFCSFVVSNGNGSPIRKQLFDKLSEYKKVDSGGRWLNNVGGPVPDKLQFESSHKFAIACENSSHIGYTTEKLVEAFAAKTVPIYWGDPEVCKVFNPKAFINALDYDSLDSLLDDVIKIDNDDELYEKMINEPALLSIENSYDKEYSRVCDFMKGIISQSIESAQRYNRVFWGEKIILHEKNLIKRSRKGVKELLLERLFGNRD